MAEKDQLIKGRADGLTLRSEVSSLNTPTDFTIGEPSINPYYYPHWGILKVNGTGERFLLTDRSFTGKPFADGGINKFFGGVPARMIREMEVRRSVVEVVDIGGGRGSLSAKEIAETYPKTKVTNIDLVVEQDTQNGNLTEKQGSILEIPLDDEIADVVYTHQVIPFLNEDRAKKALTEIKRVLRAGGVAIVDDGHYSSQGQEKIDELAEELGVKIDSADKSYGERFLILFKPAEESK